MSAALPIHPMAALFPMLPEDDLRALADDIKVNGQHEPVVLWDGQVLDGRNRLAACELAGVEPRTRTITSCPDPLAFVLSANLHRRHLNESQRAVLAAKVKPMLAEQAKARMMAGVRADNPSPNLDEGIATGRADEQAARMFDVGRVSVVSADKVLKHGTPELVTAVERGEVAVSAAVELTALPVEEQREVVAGGKDAIKAKVKEIRDAKPKREIKVQSVTRSPGQLAEEKIRAATTPQELDAAYQEASNAGLSDRECEAVADARQERGAELRAQTQTTAPAPVPAAAQPAPTTSLARVETPTPTPPRGQVGLFTQPSVAVCTQEPAPQPVSAETVTVSKAEWEAMKAEVAGSRQWQATIAQLVGAADSAIAERVIRLIALASSPNEHEAASAALKACRMIRERGLFVATSAQTANASGVGSSTIIEALRKESVEFWAEMARQVRDAIQRRA